MGFADPSPQLTVQVEGRGSVICTPAELAKLPRQTLRARDHRGAELNFGGVLLRDLLGQAGAQVGEALAKANLRDIVQVTGVDQ